VTSNHAKILDQYLADLRAAVDAVKSDPKLSEQGEAAMYGMAAKIPMRGLVNTQILKVREKLYSGEGKLEIKIEESDGEGGLPVPVSGARSGWRRFIPWTT